MLENRRRKTTNRFKNTPRRPDRAPCLSDTAVVGGVERVMHEHADACVSEGTLVADMTVPEGHVMLPTHAIHPRIGDMLPVIDCENASDGRVKLALEHRTETEEIGIGDDGFACVYKRAKTEILWVLRDKVTCSPIMQAVKPGKARRARGRYGMK